MAVHKDDSQNSELNLVEVPPSRNDKIAARFHKIHSRYVEDVEALIEEAGGRDGMSVEIKNGNFKSVVLHFLK